jgi:hypothetical protein
MAFAISIPAASALMIRVRRRKAPARLIVKAIDYRSMNRTGI